MKKLITFFALLAANIHAATNVWVSYDYSTLKMLSPTNGAAVTNWMNVNNISQKDYVTATSNALSTRIDSATNTTLTLTPRVVVLEAQTNRDINTSNRVVAIEALTNNWVKYTGTTNLTINGSVTGQMFYGNGSALTGITSTTTNGVMSVTAGGVSGVSNLVFLGTNIINSGVGTTTWQNVEWKSWQIVPNTTSWAYTMDGPRDVPFAVTNIYSKVDAYNATFSFVIRASNTVWTTVETNVADIVALPNGTITPCSFVVPVGYEWGVRVSDFDPRTLNLIVRAKTIY